MVNHREPTDNKIKKRLFWAALISMGFMGFLLMRIEWKHFPVITGRIAAKDMMLGFFMLILANFIRTLRFYKLDHVGNTLGHWWIVNQIYNFTTATLPGGAGEAATAYLLKRFSEYKILSAIRMLILTRLMDITWMSALLFFAAVSMNGTTTPYRKAAIWASAAVFIISVIVVHPKSERFIVKVLQKIPVKGRIMDKVCERLKEISRLSVNYFNGTVFTITMAQSALTIIIAALSVHFILLSFGAAFELTQSLYCFGIYAVFQVVPVQGIAGIGTQAAWWTLALTTAGYEAPDAIAMGIILHGVFYVFIALLMLSALVLVPFHRKFA